MAPESFCVFNHGKFMVERHYKGSYKPLPHSTSFFQFTSLLIIWEETNRNTSKILGQRQTSAVDLMVKLESRSATSQWCNILEQYVFMVTLELSDLSTSVACTMFDSCPKWVHWRSFNKQLVLWRLLIKLWRDSNVIPNKLRL